MRIVVTGASGKAGKWVVRDLVEHGHDVLATDVVAALPDCPAAFTRADLADYGQVVDLFTGADAVAHLANIPAPQMVPAPHTLSRNNTMNGNVFLAAADRELQRVVWASSETTLGLAFDADHPPRYAPVDEAHYPIPRSTYALSKVAGEVMAEHVSAWAGMPIAALRLSNVLEPEDLRRLPEYWTNPHSREWNLWGYIDARDSAAAFRCAIENGWDGDGAVSAIIANDDTVMDTPSKDLLAQCFPSVEVTGEFSTHGTLLSNARAKELFRWRPEHSWRTEL